MEGEKSIQVDSCSHKVLCPMSRADTTKVFDGQVLGIYFVRINNREKEKW